MSTDSETSTQIVSTLFDAAVNPAQWPTAIEALSAALGAAGACYLIQNKPSGRVESITFAGPCAPLKGDYLDYYATRDPYTPVGSATSGHLWLSHSLPAPALRHNEWYNDFVLKNGIRDILAMKLFDDGSHAVMLGVHRGKGRAGTSS